MIRVLVMANGSLLADFISSTLARESDLDVVRLTPRKLGKEDRGSVVILIEDDQPGADTITPRNAIRENTIPLLIRVSLKNQDIRVYESYRLHNPKMDRVISIIKGFSNKKNVKRRSGASRFAEVLLKSSVLAKGNLMKTSNGFLAILASLSNALKLAFGRLADRFSFVSEKIRSLKLEGASMKRYQLFWVNLSNAFNRIRTTVPMPWERFKLFRGSSRAVQWARLALILVLIITLAIPVWRVLAASYVVNNTSDMVDAAPGDGQCRTSSNTCTLRAAIMEANAHPGHDEIVFLFPGTFSLGIPTVNDDLDGTGDFDIHSPMTIVGWGAGLTIIDGGFPPANADPTARGLDRLFEIHPTAGNVTFEDLTIREGFSVEDGGAIQNWSSGLLRLEDVHVLDSYAGGAGGGLNNADPADYDWVVEPLNPPKSGHVEIVNSVFSGNAAGIGAAVNNTSTGTVSILDGSQIVNNPGEMIPDPAQIIDPLDPEPIEYVPAPGVYDPNGGAVANQGALDTVGTLRIADSVISGNFAAHDGAGVLNADSGILIIERSTIEHNTTEAAGGGVYASGGKVTITDSTISHNVAHDGGGIYSNGSVDSLGLRPHFTLTNSVISHNEAHASGGGMANGGEAVLTITDVVFDENKAWDAGGGLEISDRSSATLTRVIFSDNIAHGEGGGAWSGTNRLVTIVDSLFSGNDAGVPTPGDLLEPASANVAGGGGFYTENGPVTISGSTFEHNSATEEGGGIRMDNLADVTITDSIIRHNHADVGGGIENSATRVTFERLLIERNYAEGDGGGIYNSSSGLFTILDSTIQLNSGQSGGGLANAPDNDIIIRRSLFLRNVARAPALIEGEPAEDAGLGGGIFSLADGDSLYENTTISGNTAAVAGGGVFHDADGPLNLVNMTIWRNSAPSGGAIGVVESDFAPEVPPKANTAVIVRNSIVGGSIRGGSCDWYVTSQGGNIDTGGTRELNPMSEVLLPAETWCFLGAAPNSDISQPATRDRRAPNFTVDAIADNGGYTLTHAVNFGSLAIDGAVGACAETDQRGVERPQNSKCDIGAYEFEGPPPVADDNAPDTEFQSFGASDDSVEMMSFRFRGTDDVTPSEELQFECRLVETDLAEAPEILAPWDPIPVELWWQGCTSPWQTAAVEAGLFTFEVRAIDRAGNVDDEPATHTFYGGDTSAPETVIAEKPPLLSSSRSATFTFSATDNFTPPQFIEYECRLDSRDPDMWVECFNPTIFNNLTSGEHTIEVRATDAHDNVDQTPARYTWTIGQLPSCNAANITLTAVADGWVDEVVPMENYMFYTELSVRSSAVGNPSAVPPEPVVGQNARALYRFALPTDAPDCTLESATLRLYNDSPTEGRTLQAIPLAAPWLESTLTWFNQPATVPGITPAEASSFEGYQEWDVTSHVQAMMASSDPLPNYGWQIRDAVENDPEGGDQSFVSREMLQDPPPYTTPVLVLRYEADAAPPPEPPTMPADIVPTTVYCGQVITETTLVANDLLNCMGEGLVIGAPNIVLDLGGHTITSGVSVVSGQETGLLSGIRNSGNTNVIIRNGTVRGFGYGVMLTGGTTHNIVENMTLDANLLAGMELNDADDGRNGNTIRNNLFTSNGEAALSLVFGAENSLIIGNTFDGNGGVAFQLIEANGHLFENNTVIGIPISPLIDSDAGAQLEGSSDNQFVNNYFSDFGDAGIIILAGSNRTLVQGNTLVRSGDAGVSVSDSHGTQIIDNIAHQSSDGGVVLNGADDTVVRGNDLRFNPSGIEASNSSNLIIENNDGSNSLQTGFEIGNGLNIVIRNNVANNTGGDGIGLESGAFDALGNPVGGALIEGNTTNENAQNGITVSDGGHTIRNNEAHNNAGLGIEAGENPDTPGQPFPGTNIDGGGNKATGNVIVDQCAGIVCDTSGSVPLATPDTTAPETSLTEMPLNPTGSSSATFRFTATDAGTPLTAMIFECRLDAPPDPLPEPEPPVLEPPEPGPPQVPEPIEGEGWSECVSPVHYNNLEPGMHHFEVRARDQADNFDQTPAYYEWEVDITAEDPDASGPDSVAPTTRIASGPSNPTASNTATFYFTGSDNQTPGLNLSFECRLDSLLESDFRACTSPITYTGLSADAHTFQVRAIDRAVPANVDASPATYTWNIFVMPADTSPPDTTIGSTPDPITTLTSATFTFSSTEAGSTFECSLDDSAFAPCATPLTLTGLGVGSHELAVRAVDPAGNADPSPASFTWTVGSAPVPTTVFCGQVVTQSISLRNDLIDCLWDGLVIGAPGITIDLNGHTIDGKGIAAGIRNDGYDYVSIRNGTITDFDYGVMLNPGTTFNIVDSVSLENNQEAGVALGLVPHPLDPSLPFPPEPPLTYQAGVSDNIIRNSDFLANDSGVWLTHGTQRTKIHDNEIRATSEEGVRIERSSNNLVESNEISAGGAGIGLRGSNNNTILNNTLSENGNGVVIEATVSGVTGVPSNDNLVEGNVISESGGDAIEISESDGNQIIDNVANYSNGEGVSMYFAEDTLVRGNDLRYNKGGISLKNSSDNRLESNNASESTDTGISLEAQSLNNEIFWNISSNNTGSGIYVGDETASDTGVWIEGNITNNNNGYGIHVPKVSHVIKGNVANENGTWGIYVSDGSNGRENIDGGGNRAQDNLGPIDSYTLQPLQCFSVVCDGTSPATDPIPPDTLILESPADPSAAPASFHFTGSDNAGDVTFECKLDSDAFAACESPVTLSPAAGLHTFTVRAVDISGNVDGTPAAYTWTVSPAGPLSAAILSGPDLTTVQTSASFEFSASQSGATFECALDGGAFAACASPKSYTGLAVGAHTFNVRARNIGGDISPVATYAWTIGPAPVPATVSCGEVIVQSTRLQNDLLDCGGHALIVGANGITIDLNGHFIDGVGLDAGILNNGYDSVTITNGTIVDFDYGILLNPGTSLNVIDSMRLELNAEAGIALSDADQNGKGNTVRNNTFVSNGYGVALFTNTRFAYIHNNAFSSNAADAIHLEFASDNRIVGNEVTNSGGSAIFMMGGGNNTVSGNSLVDNNGFGVVAGEELLPSNNNRIERNTIIGGQGGISVADSSGNQILYNEVGSSFGPGIALSLADNTLVRGNDVGSNASGIEISESSSNQIEGNNASGALGSGISIEALSYNNVVVQNAANQNGGDGISVEDSALAGQGNLLDRNTADNNGGDGIAVLGVGHTLTGNSAQLNGGWGIYVAVGATDGGSNFAAGNIEPAQCFNIVCTLGEVPGAPDTWIVTKPPLVSNSRNASFTYMGSDDVNLLRELVFECRLDSTNDLDWVDCEYPAEYLNLSPGTHTFQVRAVDLTLRADPTPATYTWTYEPLPAGVAPQVILDVTPDAETWVLDALFTFHSNEPDVTFECRVDAFGYEPCGFEGVNYMSRGAYEWSLTETEVGLHTFYVRAIDFEGNVGTPTTFTWRLLGLLTTFTDGPGFTPGETPFDPPTGGEVASPIATLDFIANMADVTYECSLDLAPFTPCVPPVTYTGLLAGDHNLRVVATNSEGISELEAAVYEWSVMEVIDVTPPDTLIERAPAPNSSSTVFEFVGVDDLTPPSLLTFECRVDSTNELDWFACISPFNMLDLYTYQDLQMAPGEHTFEVRAIDMAEPLDPTSTLEGNVDPTPASYTWIMVADTVRPGTGILSGPEPTVGTGAEIVLEFFGTDNATPAALIEFECSINLGAYEPCSSPHTIQGLEPGSYTLRVRAVDLAGNVDASPSNRAWTVVAAPQTTITSGPAGQVVNGAPQQPFSSTESAIFVFSSDQPGSTFECSLDGADYLPCTSPRAYWITTNGLHEFAVRATNPEGVVEEPPVVYEWMVELGPDLTAPNTSIISRPSNPDTSSVATFTFSGSDNRTPSGELTFECALDGTAFNSCVSPQQFSDLTHASHTMLIRARDAAGNFDPTPASYTWTVELPPVVTFISAPAEITESTTAEFAFASNVPGSTFQCWLDGVMESCTSPKTYTGLAAGDHYFAVLATAPAGTTSVQWEEWEWTIGDLSAPVTSITSSPAPVTESTVGTFEFTSEPGATFTCSLDNAEPVPCASPHTYPNLSVGAHTFSVQAVTPHLLVEPVPASFEWTVIDLTAPVVSIQYGPAATTASASAYFGFISDDPYAIIECRLDLDVAGFSECESPAEFTDLLPGVHLLEVRAVDLAGNIGDVVSYPWTIVVGTENTPVGTNVTVNLPFGGGTASINFFEVTLAGSTTIDVLNGAPLLPAGYLLAGGQYYDINTTAEYGTPVTICVPFNPADFPDSAVRLLHYDGNAWVDITTTSDPAGTVCGVTEGFSPFALVTGSGLTPLATIISGPPNPSFSSTATFTFWSDQPDTMTQCSIDGMPFTLCSSPVTYTHLEAGFNTFMVQAVGNNGQVQITPSVYEWEVILPPDTTAPDTTITAGPASLTAIFISTFEFTGSDDQTHALELEFECSLNGGPFESCSVPHEVEVPAAGPQSFAVRAVDMSGNVDPTPATREWTVVDLSAPETSIDLGPDSETAETSATFEFSGVDGLTDAPVFQFECALDNADFAPCTSPHVVTGLAAGPHVFHVRAVDPGGTVDPSPEFYEWLILDTAGDTTPPDTFIIAGPPVDNSGPDVLFGFASNEPVAGYECSLDAGPFEGCDAVYELLGLASGSHTLQVRAIDLAEIPNVDPTPASYAWTTLGEPDTTILSGPAALSDSYSATFTFESDQAGATFQCSVDGSLPVPCTSPFVAGPLTADTHTFEVWAVNQFTYADGTRVLDMTPAFYEWTIQDTTAPETTITSVTYVPPTDLLEPNSFRFEFTGSDNVTAWFELSFECSLDGEPFSGCTSPHYLPLEGLSGGDHTMQIRAVDDLDNIDPSPATYTWTTEGEPQTTILTGPAAQVESNSASFTFTSNQAGATFECSLDLAPFSACTSPITFAGIPYGEHQLLVRAISPLGTMTETTPAEYTWESGDMTPPVVTVLTGPTAVSDPLETTLSTTATFTFSADDPASVFQCSLDGSPLTFCASPVTYTDLQGGAHTFEVIATKPNLLVEGIPGLWEWTVLDQTAPETVIESGPAASIGQNSSASFVFSSNEPNVTFECSLNGGAFTTCAVLPDTTAEFTGLAAGAYTLNVRAVDQSLNADATPAQHSWEVVGPPLTTITAGPPTAPATTSDTTATFEFASNQTGSTFACSLNGGAFAPCVSPAVYTDLAYATHTFEVRATNSFGLVEVSPVSYEWTIVMPPPAIPPDTLLAEPLPSNPTTAASATFSFTSDLSGSTFQCSLDGASFAACSSPVEYTALAEGSHTFQVRAVNAGITDSSPAVHLWTIDFAPETTITSGPPAEALGTTASFIFASNELGVSFECSLDEAGYTSCPASYVLSNLADGPHTLSVRAKDGNGNLDPTPASHSWTTLAPPETAIVSGPPESPLTTSDTTATFTFSSNQAGSTFECSLDEFAFVACASPVTYTGLAVQDHTFAVRAVNSRGQVDATPAEYEWTIVLPPDTTAPETTISSTPPASTSSTSASFAFSSNEDGSTFECSLDGSAFTLCVSPRTYSGLSVSSHTFRVRAVDPAGNVDASPALYTWTVTPPPNCGGPVTVNAVADAWIDQGSTTANKGTDSILKVQGKSGNNFRALLRFNLPAAPAGCVVQSATLRLYAASWTTGRTLQVLRINASWTENGVTWANQPATTGTAVTTTSGSGYRSWNVLTLVQAMYSGSNFGFLIRDANETGGGAEQQFHSREKGSSLPQLVITFGPAP